MSGLNFFKILLDSNEDTNIFFIDFIFFIKKEKPNLRENPDTVIPSKSNPSFFTKLDSNPFLDPTKSILESFTFFLI